jgi:hypothetical protein
MKTIDAVMKYTLSDTKAVKLHDTLIGILAKFEGKKITKRLETEVRKHFPNAYLKHVGSMTYLELDYRDKEYRSYLLAYDAAPYTEESFRKQNAWSGSAALERTAKNNAWAAEHSAKVEEKLTTIKRLLQELNDEALEFNSYDCPAFYEILREHDLEDLKKVM